MLAALPPLDAYRMDLAQLPGMTAFGRDDGAWLLVAEILARLARRPSPPNAALRARLSEALGATDWPDVAADPVAADTALARDVVAYVERVEEGGALQLAYSTLALAHGAAPAAAAPQQAMTFARRARVARKLGDLEVAESLYDEAARIGRAADDATALAWAMLGKGVVARMRGNYPEARTHFRKLLAIAERAGLRDLQAMAHHGLLIGAGVAGDFDTALQHGWAAFELAAGDVERQAELLFNVAAASSDAGFDAAALQGYLAAASRLTSPRLRLPALAGAALSAARVGDAVRLRAITDDLHQYLSSSALSYERAQALALLADAWATHQPESGGEPYREQALALARAHGYHEIVHQAESVATPRAAAPRAPQSVAPPTRRVLDALEALPDRHAWAGAAGELPATRTGSAAS
jgi:tetratricopeptide (TPR) repeat protein